MAERSACFDALQISRGEAAPGAAGGAEPPAFAPSQPDAQP